MKKSFVSLVLIIVLITISNTLAGDVQSIASGKWSNPATWLGGVIPAPYDNVKINGDTVTYDIDSMVIGNLVIGNGSSGLFRTADSQYVKLYIKGDIIVNALAGFKSMTNKLATNVEHIFYLEGSITNNGNNFDCRNGTTGSTLSVIKFVLMGSGNTNITMNGGYVSSNNEFNAVEIRKTGAGRVKLYKDMYFAGGSSAAPNHNSVLTFVTGIVETVGDATLVHLSTTSATITGASSSSYVQGNMARGMSSSGGKTNEFAIGDANGFRPINIRTTTAGTATGHFIRAACISGDANTGSSTFPDGLIDKVSKVRFYKISYNSGGVGAASMTVDRLRPSYGAGDGIAAGNNNLRVGFSINERAAWQLVPDVSPDSTVINNPYTYYTCDSLPTPYVLNSGTNSIYIAFARVTGTTENTLEAGAATINRVVPVNNGWNLVSVPLRATDMSKSAIFPTSTSNAFEYNGGYVVADSLKVAKGYWLKFGAAENVNIAGTVLTPKSFQINEGWNMIGNFENSTAISSINSNPAGIVISSYFGYNNGYFTVDTLKSGSGYWVKSNQAGTLTIGTALNKATAIKFNRNNNYLTKITISDSRSRVTDLYLFDRISDNSFELPPQPPADIYDVRFANNMIASDMNSGEAIRVSGAEYPVKIRIQGDGIKIKDKVTGELVSRNMKEGDELVINNPAINMLSIGRNSFKVLTTELMQNYPNPFNPTTKIKFGLSEKSKISLSVYNIIGEKIEDIVKGVLESGDYEYEWNGKSLSSGIYFYKLSVNDRTFVKKMLLTK